MQRNLCNWKRSGFSTDTTFISRKLPEEIIQIINDVGRQSSHVHQRHKSFYPDCKEEMLFFYWRVFFCFVLCLKSTTTGGKENVVVMFLFSYCFVMLPLIPLVSPPCPAWPTAHKIDKHLKGRFCCVFASSRYYNPNIQPITACSKLCQYQHPNTAYAWNSHLVLAKERKNNIRSSWSVICFSKPLKTFEQKLFTWLYSKIHTVWNRGTDIYRTKLQMTGNYLLKVWQHNFRFVPDEKLDEDFVPMGRNTLKRDEKFCCNRPNMTSNLCDTEEQGPYLFRYHLSWTERSVRRKVPAFCWCTDSGC